MDPRVFEVPIVTNLSDKGHWMSILNLGHCLRGSTIWESNLALENPLFTDDMYIHS
jgi:hypothetical protein